MVSARTSSILFLSFVLFCFVNTVKSDCSVCLYMSNPEEVPNAPGYCVEAFGGVQTEKNPFRGISGTLTSFHYVTIEGDDCNTCGCSFEAFSASGKVQSIDLESVTGIIPTNFCAKSYELSCPY